MSHVWSALVGAGLLKDLLASSLAFGVAHLFAWLPGPVRAHMRAQKKIANSLDTSSPGGLTDLVAAVSRKAPPPPPKEG